MDYIEELNTIADFVGGYRIDGGLAIRIDTGDRTSNENGDELRELLADIDFMLVDYEVSDSYADHDTIIMEFSKNI